MKEFYKELELLEEYMPIYIQLLTYCVEFGGSRIYKHQIPTFEYFKQTYNDERYSLSKPFYKDFRYKTSNGELFIEHYKGLVEDDRQVDVRYFNYYIGCKFYTGKNTNGEFR